MTLSNDPWEQPDPDASRFDPSFGGGWGQSGGEVPEHGTLNPWWSVWAEPRKTYRYVRTHVGHNTVVTLTMIAGIFVALSRASNRDLGDTFSLGEILLFSAIGGPLGNLVKLYLVAWLVGVTGRWLGGVGRAEDLRFAYGWASPMVITAGVLWLPQLILFGKECFTSEMPSLDANPDLAYAAIGIGLFMVAAGVWTVVCALKMIGEAHLFSAWRALGASLLAGLMIIGPVIVLGTVIALLTI